MPQLLPEYSLSSHIKQIYFRLICKYKPADAKMVRNGHKKAYSTALRWRKGEGVAKCFSFDLR